MTPAFGHLVRFLPIWVAVASAVSCASASAGTGTAPADASWSKKTRRERMELMARVVVPRMRRLFQDHDRAAYGNFRCQTCHGDDMERMDFHMPNRRLPRLSSEAPVEHALQRDAPMARFMRDGVLPALADELGIPIAVGGLSCFSCHPKE